VEKLVYWANQKGFCSVAFSGIVRGVRVAASGGRRAMAMDIETIQSERGASEGTTLIETTAGAVSAKGPLGRLREAARNALSQRMSMETSDLAHRIRRIHDQPDTTQ
jgi:hypothetical protein